MKLSDQVCSFGLAKKLKELGVKQDSYFYWVITTDGPAIKSLNEDDKYMLGDSYRSAFTVAELGELLPLGYLSIRTMGGTANDTEIKPYWLAYNELDGIDDKYQMELTEANARSKMLIHLLENKLIGLPK